ncbi:hypothetical protein BV25DRAFT_1920782 [Artomyces pyxidatus]|uniref:Uncharacterized protein n=1 Tax=Artomyces pyxidatus TaxID=48021 RepID=A0ACB8SKA2_9AGAM|nr:hypothetical protein BV25DRAFT_1920782 [Artomyces pyxidatus]
MATASPSSHDIALEQETARGYWNAALIFADDDDAAINLDYVRLHLTLVHLDTPIDEALSEDEITDVLGPGEKRHLLNFYEGARGTFSWFYSAYGFADPNDKPINRVASVLMPGKHPIVRGNVLIVKNGPETGAWKTNATIEEDTLARCLWWYHASGNSAQDVGAERNMMRWMDTMFNT